MPISIVNASFTIKPNPKERGFYMINMAMRKRYEKIASLWNSQRYKGLRRDDLIPLIIKFSDTPQKSSTVLEAMCGTGLIGTAIKDKYKQVNIFFLDASIEMLNEITSKGEKCVGDVCKMPYNANYFNRIIIRFGIHDIAKNFQQDAFKEVFRILKRNGIFILVAHYTNHAANQKILHQLVQLKDKLSRHPTTDRYFPTMREYLELFSAAGFTKIKVRYKFYSLLEYQKTGEMDEMSKNIWGDFVLSIPKNIKKELFIKKNNYGLTYRFPAVIITGVKE